jgi:hypothetical protein
VVSTAYDVFSLERATASAPFPNYFVSRFTAGAAGFLLLIQCRGRNIGRAEALRHGAFKAELARMAKYNVTAFGNVFVQLKSPRGLAEQLGKRSLAIFEGSAAQVFAAQLEEIKDEQDRL